MVQARQFRRTHCDSHYAAALFRYERECAIMFKDYSTFVCLDDKHRIKTGEPGYPVAAVERGRKVIMSRNSSFDVADHDFTKFSIVPSVCFFVDIPDSIEESWYRGKTFIGYKDAVFEPSSPQRHITELYSILKSNCQVSNPIVFLYTDGGPDHRLTYINVQLSLISLYLTLDLDFLCACRTAPYHSWKNPVERLMSIVNIGLQSVGMMRKEAPAEIEVLLSKCNNRKQLRKVAEDNADVVSEVADSIAPVKILLSEITRRLELKQLPFGVFHAATEEEISEVWKSLHRIDSALCLKEKCSKSTLKTHSRVKEFIDHCCQVRHYSFCIKKCGAVDCSICKPPRMPSKEFKKVHFIPDPVPKPDDHYQSFQELMAATPLNSIAPLLHRDQAGQIKTLPFVASIQHVCNVGVMVQCEECQMWRLLYSPRKLSAIAVKELNSLLEDFTYTCGASLSDLDLPPMLSSVCVRDIHCHDPVEKLYYSMKYDPICIYCCSTDNLILTSSSTSYPQCEDCKDKPSIHKRT